MGEFLTLVGADQARAMLAAGFAPVGVERVPLAEADGRVTAEALIAPEDLPAEARAVMDGFAVPARDTFGAQDGSPAYARVRGAVEMGRAPSWPVGTGEAAEIPTGGVLPEGADAVVMVEYTQRVGEEVEIRRGVAPGENVVRAGDDVRRGEILCPAGVRLGPMQVAVLAALGMTAVPMHRRPRVGILSTGNEVVPVDGAPAPGQVRDVNAQVLAAQARRAGAEVVLGGIARDELGELRGRTQDLLAACDLVMLSGGSSVGARDLTARAFGELGAEILFHGISVRPGKPTLCARVGGKPLLGMPGVPVSAAIIFHAFVRPLVWALGGEVGREPWPSRRRARLSRRTASVAGREDWLRVRLVPRDGGLWAEPLLGGSAALSTLLRADGLVCVPAGVEGVAEGEEVDVLSW